MDEKTDIMVALSVAIGANCIPCFDHIYGKAIEVGLSDREIKRIIATADKVKNGASIFLKNAMNEVLGEQKVSESPCCVNSEEKCC